MFDKELEQVIKSFTFSKIITKSSFIILVNGKRATLRSGKSVWSTIGHAKSALKNHLGSYYWYTLGQNKKNEMYDYLIQNKIVEFKEVL
jgi:hypothetical protein